MLSARLTSLDNELVEIFAGRDELGPAFPMMLEGWFGAAIRELTRMEFPPAEIEQLLETRLRTAVRAAKFTGPLPR